MPEFQTIFRLSRRPGDGVFCGADGLSVGDVALLERAPAPDDAGPWRARPSAELNRDLSRCYGLPIEIGAKTGGLEAVAQALDRGDLAHAQMTALHLRFPDPPDIKKAAGDVQAALDLARRLEASGLLKGEWDPELHPRWLAGSPDSVGGRFAPKDSQGGGAASRSQGAAHSRGARARVGAIGASGWTHVHLKEIADYLASQGQFWAFKRVSSPAAAPKTIDLSPMNNAFQLMMKESFLDGAVKERGVTIFGDSKGNLSLANYGGYGSDDGNFSLDLEAPEFLWIFPSPLRAVGDFHTHPYKNHQWLATFSGRDVAAQINTGLNFSVVQSEGVQWLLLSTAQTLKIRVNSNDMELNAQVQNKKFMDRGYTFTEAETKVVSALAVEYNMVLYEGKNGVFDRIN